MNNDANAVIQQGDDDTIVAPIKDADDPSNAFLSDLSVYDFNYSLTDRKTDGSIILDEGDVNVTFNTASNINSQDLDDTGVTDTDDVVLIEFSGSNTASLDAGTYWHELELDDGSTVQTVFRGKVTIELTTA